jgi:hypothetical protein
VSRSGCGAAWFGVERTLVVAVSVHTELLFALESADGSKRFAEAENLDSILLAAATLREDGEDVDSMVVLRAGAYDGGTTALIQENLI